MAEVMTAWGLLRMEQHRLPPGSHGFALGWRGTILEDDMGRQSKYTQKIADEICARLSTGEPLAQICREETMPAVSTVSDWKAAHKDFAVAIARAREDGFDAIAAECLAIANTPLEGVEKTEKADGGIEVKRGDMLGHRKLQIETRLKLLAKWDPKRYGERLEVAGDPKNPLGVVVTVKDYTGRKRDGEG